MEVSGKKVIVTGGSGGMGTAIVRVLVANGALVTSVDLVSDRGCSVVEDANKAGGPGKGWYREVDLRRRDSVFPVFAEAAEEMGGLDALVHTAGVHRLTAATEVTDEVYDLIMDVNVRGTVIANQAAFEPMNRSGGGSIINFGSISGLRAEPTSLIYSASKGAVHSWTRSLSQVWGQYRIRVNAVLPIMATPMAQAAMDEMTDEEVNANFGRDWSQIAIGNKWGDAERDLCPVVAFLISDASHFITGQLLPVDGGLIGVR